MWIDIKYSFTWLTGMKKLIFYVNNFLGSGHFFDPWYLKKDQKIAGIKNFFVSKNQFCHARQPCKGIFDICFVFSHFFVRASNCSHYSNFGNNCPKRCTGTPEDMILTNLGDNLDSDPSGFVLQNSYGNSNSQLFDAKFRMMSQNLDIKVLKYYFSSLDITLKNLVWSML